MASNSLVLDESDPCATAAALRQEYANVVAGQKARDIQFVAGVNGVQRRMSMHDADPARLLALVREWEAKCQKLSGARPARRVYRAGGWR